MSTFTSMTYTTGTDGLGGSLTFGKYFTMTNDLGILFGGTYTDAQGHVQTGYQIYELSADGAADPATFSTLVVPHIGQYFSTEPRLTPRGLPSSDSVALITKGGFKGDYLVTLPANSHGASDQVLVSEQHGHVHLMEFSESTVLGNLYGEGSFTSPTLVVVNGNLKLHGDASYQGWFVSKTPVYGVSYSAHGEPQGLALYEADSKGNLTFGGSAPLTKPFVSHGVSIAFSTSFDSGTTVVWTSSGNAKTGTDLGVAINTGQLKHGIYLSDGQHTLVHQADTFVVGAGDNTFRLASHSATVIAEGGDNHVLIRSAPGSHDVLVFNQSSPSSAAGSSVAAGPVATINIVAPGKTEVSFHTSVDAGGNRETILHIGHTEVDLMGVHAKNAADLSALGITLHIQK